MIEINKKFQGVFLVCFAAALWGFDSVVLTPRLFKLDVAYVVFMLHFLPFLGMTLLFGKKQLKKICELDNSTLFYFFLISLFGGALGTLAIVKALFLVNFHHLSIVTLLQKLQPIFAVILAKFFLKEKLGKNFIFWTILALIAGYFLTFEFSIPSFNENNMLKASFLSIVAAFSFGSSTVFSKKVLFTTDFKTALYIRYFFTTIITLIILIFNRNLLTSLNSTSLIHWLIFTLIGLTSGSGAIYIYYKGLNYIPASISTICELTFPISAIIFDYLINNEVLSNIQTLSAAILIFSIIKIIFREQPLPTSKESI